MTIAPQRYTLTIEGDLYEILKERAEANRRSLNKEILFLIEGSLASEIEGNVQILRMLMRAQGGPPTPQSAQGGPPPAHTATGGQSSGSLEPAASQG